MAVQQHELEARFRPLRPASGPRLVLAAVLGPLTWLIAFVVVSLIVHLSNAIELGLLITAISLVLAAIVLALLRRRRDREERRYVARD